MNKIVIALPLILFFVLASNGQKKVIYKNTKDFVTNTDVKNIPDSLLNKMSDTGLIKIGYDSFLTTKLFEYLYLKDITFDKGKITLNAFIKKLPYKFYKKRYNNGADEDYLVVQTHYFFTKKSYLIEGGNKGQEIVIGIITNDSSISNSIYDIRVGDSISKFCKFYPISCIEIKNKLATYGNSKSLFTRKENFVDIDIYENKQKQSEYFLRYVWDIEVKKIIRIEVVVNDNI